MRELLKDEYEIVGTIMGMGYSLTFQHVINSRLSWKFSIFYVHTGLSILQNGKLPQFVPPVIISEMFNENCKLPCIESLRIGLKKVGIFQVRSFFLSYIAGANSDLGQIFHKTFL